MTTRANAIHQARQLARAKQETIYVVFDPTAIDAPPDRAFYPAAGEEVDTFYGGCEIVAAVEPEEIAA